jgi:hypothetical protein
MVCQRSDSDGVLCRYVVMHNKAVGIISLTDIIRTALDL